MLFNGQEDSNALCRDNLIQMKGCRMLFSGSDGRYGRCYPRPNHNN